MLSDKELGEVIAAEGKEESGRNPSAKAKAAIRKVAPDEAKTLVWVKCITDLEPWTESFKLEHWKNYQIELGLATLMEDRKHVVILREPKE